MSLWELFLIGVGLSMDAFAVAICQGLCMPKLNLKKRRCDCPVFWWFSGVDASDRLVSWLTVFFLYPAL